ncbi:RecT family recombinase [Acinetobacter oleivorans]|uniref:RecT family recombinase n=1 Tax=Acinetobacter oleivorans TaxID=1148157 RepID=UPI001250446C|nr:RecT family recombinase [Acinetobacter oleivorans]
MNTAVSNLDQGIATQSAPISAFEILMNPEMMARFEKLAETMAASKFSVPKHLQNNPSDCLAIIMQSIQWQMDPFAVAQKTHQINGVLGYEAQLVNAVIINRAPVKERLNYEWFGDWSKVNGKEDKSYDRGVKVWATLRGETSPREIVLTMGQVGPVRNSPMWIADPRQQIAYLAIKRWSRLYTPDVILGVYTPDEVIEREELDVTPEPSKTPRHQGTAGLKAQLADREQSKETVIDLAVSFDVEKCIEDIGKVENLTDLKTLGSTIPSDLGEPAQTDIKNAYANQKFYLQLVDDLEIANSIEAINSIMEKQFEPNTSFLTDAQIDAVSSLFERKTAELTA